MELMVKNGVKYLELSCCIVPEVHREVLSDIDLKYLNLSNPRTMVQIAFC